MGVPVDEATDDDEPAIFNTDDNVGYGPQPPFYGQELGRQLVISSTNTLSMAFNERNYGDGDGLFMA